MSQRIQEGNTKLKIERLDGGGMPIYYYEGKPFTGIVFKNREDASLAWEEEYLEGLQEGWCYSYYKDGKKAQEYKAHNNIEIDGTFKEWDENGNLILSY